MKTHTALIAMLALTACTGPVFVWQPSSDNGPIYSPISKLFVMMKNTQTGHLMMAQEVPLNDDGVTLFNKCYPMQVYLGNQYQCYENFYHRVPFFETNPINHGFPAYTGLWTTLEHDPFGSPDKIGDLPTVNATPEEMALLASVPGEYQPTLSFDKKMNWWIVK